MKVDFSMFFSVSITVTGILTMVCCSVVFIFVSVFSTVNNGSADVMDWMG